METWCIILAYISISLWIIDCQRLSLIGASRLFNQIRVSDLPTMCAQLGRNGHLIMCISCGCGPLCRHRHWLGSNLLNEPNWRDTLSCTCGNSWEMNILTNKHWIIWMNFFLSLLKFTIYFLREWCVNVI